MKNRVFFLVLRPFRTFTAGRWTSSAVVSIHRKPIIRTHQIMIMGSRSTIGDSNLSVLVLVRSPSWWIMIGKMQPYALVSHLHDSLFGDNLRPSSLSYVDFPWHGWKFDVVSVICFTNLNPTAEHVCAVNLVGRDVWEMCRLSTHSGSDLENHGEYCLLLTDGLVGLMTIASASLTLGHGFNPRLFLHTL